eukprot:TRINITY_DN14153_c0_g2_i1.p1 TRINITY_DN14153_c0_g2~~TRINITY_DN14153_c0_g2_i1.p1  ORF type:complete len:602 (-),score=139.05 TRINITY_DN14153_c0_g2_i1:785-2368(-)
MKDVDEVLRMNLLDFTRSDLNKESLKEIREENGKEQVKEGETDSSSVDRTKDIAGRRKGGVEEELKSVERMINETEDKPRDPEEREEKEIPELVRQKIKSTVTNENNLDGQLVNQDILKTERSSTDSGCFDESFEDSLVRNLNELERLVEDFGLNREMYLESNGKKNQEELQSSDEKTEQTIRDNLVIEENMEGKVLENLENIEENLDEGFTGEGPNGKLQELEMTSKTKKLENYEDSTEELFKSEDKLSDGEETEVLKNNMIGPVRRANASFRDLIGLRSPTLVLATKDQQPSEQEISFGSEDDLNLAGSWNLESSRSQTQSEDSLSLSLKSFHFSNTYYSEFNNKKLIIVENYQPERKVLILTGKALVPLVTVRCGKELDFSERKDWVSYANNHKEVYDFNVYTKKNSKDRKCFQCQEELSFNFFEYGIFCYYTGKSYCTRCHTNKTHLIPAFVVHRWDFTPMPVCEWAFSYLRKFWKTPFVDIFNLNPSLYSNISLLNTFKAFWFPVSVIPGWLDMMLNILGPP